MESEFIFSDKKGVDAADETTPPVKEFNLGGGDLVAERRVVEGINGIRYPPRSDNLAKLDADSFF